MVLLELGSTQVEIHDGFVKTILPNGSVVCAKAHTSKRYNAQAKALGYQDPAAMNRDHDLAHVLLAKWLGLPASPALEATSRNKPPTLLTGAEEDLVLALQRFVNLAQLDLVDLAWENQS